MRLFKTIASLTAALITTFASATVIERETLIISNNARTVTLSTNGTILLSGVDITQVITNNVFPPLGKTNAGVEGFRLIGALGGYTLEEFVEDTATRGPARDLPTFSFQQYPNNNLVVSYSGGDIYDPINGYFHLNAGSKTLVDNSVNYAYWRVDDPLVVKWTSVRPQASNSVYLATFVTAFGSIMHGGLAIGAGDELLYEDVAFASIMPSVITEGLNVYATGTNLTNIVINSGVEYHNMADRIDHAQFDFNTSNKLVMYSHTNGAWGAITTNLFPIGKWDNGTNIINCDTSKWYRGLFVSIANSGQLNFVLPDSEYTNSTEAIAGSDPDLPPGFTPYIPPCTAYIFSGQDVSLRTESTYWVNRRNSTLLFANSGSVSGGGGSANTPTLEAVLRAGAGTGGLLPTGMGFPVTDDEAASKGYVDSTRNKASTGTAYVDATNGNDGTGQIEKASLPFKTIQAAINACAAVATDSRRFLVAISIGTYVEDVIMKDFISVRGLDIESTIIKGSVTWPSAYLDTVGGELQVLSVHSSNKAAVVFSPGVDNAYIGTRSVALYSTWTNNAAVKCTIQSERGWVETYGTTWVQLDVVPDGSAADSTGVVCSIYATTNSLNLGNTYYNDFCGSYIINCSDTNDIISLMYSDSTGEDYVAVKNSAARIDLTDSTNHNNRVSAIYHNGSDSRSYMNGSSIDVMLDVTNSVTIIMAYVANSAGDGSEAHFNTSRILCPNITSNSSYIGAAIATNDRVEIFNSSIAAAAAASASTYPKKYTVNGSAGTVAYVVNHTSGDILMGGGLDMSASAPAGINPDPGNFRL